MEVQRKRGEHGPYLCPGGESREGAVLLSCIRNESMDRVHSQPPHVGTTLTVMLLAVGILCSQSKYLEVVKCLLTMKANSCLPIVPVYVNYKSQFFPSVNFCC